MVVGAGFEPAKLSRQIYSLIPLATREPHLTTTLFYSGAFQSQAVDSADSAESLLLRAVLYFEWLPPKRRRILVKRIVRCNAFAAFFQHFQPFVFFTDICPYFSAQITGFVGLHFQPEHFRVSLQFFDSRFIACFQ